MDAGGRMGRAWPPSPNDRGTGWVGSAPTILGIARLLALIALLPKCDGAGDWDRQEGDED